MMAFLRTLDIDFSSKFTCPICKDLPHEQMCITMDAKEMGMAQRCAKPYVPPSSSDESARVPLPL